VNGVTAGTVLGSLETAADRFVALDLRFVLVALAFQLTNLALRSLALRNVIAAAYPGTCISRWTVGGAYAAGVALNAFAPARGGEALKIALLRLRIHGSSVPTLVAIGVAAGAVAVVAVLAAGPLARRARSLWLHLEQGGAILRTPGRYLRSVALLQLGGWACRTGVAFSLLAAFGLPATVPLALLVVVAGGLSTLVPVPGGAGTQQVLLVYALQQTASTASALSFSVGMQVGITAFNTMIGLAALMLMFRTLRPVAAVRAARGGRP
jgi:uncharacterized membrane protein YbhN (UPF0104 family)